MRVSEEGMVGGVPRLSRREPPMRKKGGWGERERPSLRSRDTFGYLTVEDVLRRGLLVLHVPHQGHPVWLVRSVLIVIV